MYGLCMAASAAADGFRLPGAAIEPGIDGKPLASGEGSWLMDDGKSGGEPDGLRLPLGAFGDEDAYAFSAFDKLAEPAVS